MYVSVGHQIDTDGSIDQRRRRIKQKKLPYKRQ